MRAEHPRVPMPRARQIEENYASSGDGKTWQRRVLLHLGDFSFFLA